MQFETYASIGLAWAILLFLFIRRRVITDLKERNANLEVQIAKLNKIASRQGDELQRLIEVAAAERRARQMQTLSGQRPMPKPPQVIHQEKKEAASRRRFDQVNDWQGHQPATPLPALDIAPAESPSYRGHGTFDGGGASGDYGRSESNCTSSSDSSDSGSSGSSDSGSSCGSD